MTAFLFVLSALGNPIGNKAPDFKLRDTEGSTHQLSQYEGKVVVLEWFNPGCPFVKYVHNNAIMNKKYETIIQEKTNEDNSVVWLAVNSSAVGKQGAGLKVNEQAREKWGLKYPVLLDETGEVGKQYNAMTTPQMYVINRKGVLVYAGALDNAPMGKASGKEEAYFDDALKAVLKGEAVQVAQTKPYGCSVKYAK